MSKFSRALKRTPKFWWYLMNFWTLVVFGMIAVNFIVSGLYEKSLNALLVVYIALLAIYAGDKEFERWHDHHAGRHPGEIYVILWTLIIAALAICEFILHKEGFGLTSEITAAYIAVLSILAITRRSRALYEKRKKRI